MANVLSGVIYRLYAIAIGFDVLANALTGGRAYQTLSCRCGESIAAGGCADAVFSSIV